MEICGADLLLKLALRGLQNYSWELRQSALLPASCLPVLHVRGPWGRRVTFCLVFCMACLSNHTGMRITLCCPDYFAGNPCGNINTDMQRCTHTHTVIVSFSQATSLHIYFFMFPDDNFRLKSSSFFTSFPLSCACKVSREERVAIYEVI